MFSLQVAAHGPRHHRRHGKPLARDVGAQSKPVIMRRADGTPQCRVRPASDNANNNAFQPAAAAAAPSETTQTQDWNQAWAAPTAQPSADAPEEWQGDSNSNAWTQSDSNTWTQTTDSASTQTTDSWTAAPTETQAVNPDYSYGSKYGWAYPEGSLPIMASYVTDCNKRVSWFYTWSSRSDEWNAFAQKGWDIEFVPMVWGEWRTHDNAYSPQLFRDSSSTWPASTKHALFVNEPEIPGQAAISAEDALYKIWWPHYQPVTAEKGLSRGHAAIADFNGGANWLRTFNSICSGDCNVDFYPVHWYGLSVEDFKTALTNFYNEFGKPIWVTEYACHAHDLGVCDDGMTWYFHQQARAWMDSVDWIHRYAPYGAMPAGYGDIYPPINPNNNMMNIESYGSPNFLSLSPMGNYYAN